MPCGWPYLARPKSQAIDGHLQDIEYRWAWRGSEIPSKFCPIFNTFGPTVRQAPQFRRRGGGEQDFLVFQAQQEGVLQEQLLREGQQALLEAQGKLARTLNQRLRPFDLDLDSPNPLSSVTFTVPSDEYVFTKKLNGRIIVVDTCVCN
jgi:hypothetical protein